MIKNNSLNCDVKKIQLYEIENEPNSKNIINSTENFHSIYTDELDIHYINKKDDKNLENNSTLKKYDEESFLKLYGTPFLG